MLEVVGVVVAQRKQRGNALEILIFTAPAARVTGGVGKLAVIRAGARVFFKRDVQMPDLTDAGGHAVLVVGLLVQQQGPVQMLERQIKRTEAAVCQTQQFQAFGQAAAVINRIRQAAGLLGGFQGAFRVNLELRAGAFDQRFDARGDEHGTQWWGGVVLEHWVLSGKWVEEATLPVG